MSPAETFYGIVSCHAPFAVPLSWQLWKSCLAHTENLLALTLKYDLLIKDLNVQECDATKAQFIFCSRAQKNSTSHT